MRSTRRTRILAMAAAVFGAGTACQGAISYLSGSGTFEHFRNNSFTVGSTLYSIPMGATVYSHSYSNSANGAKTQAIGGVNTVTNATTATFTLASGTGITESDPPTAAWPSGSKFTIALNNLRWNVPASNSFGPTSTAYMSVTVAGVVGSGGSGTFNVSSLSFRSASGTGGSVLASTTAFLGGSSSSVNFATAGTFSKTVTFSSGLTPNSLIAGNNLYVNAVLNFAVNNDDTPTLLEPIAVDVGGAPATAQYDAEMLIEPRGVVPHWSDPLNWDANDVLVPGIVPNHVGDRALFMPATNMPRPRSVQADIPITLGTLDIDNPSGSDFTIEAAPVPASGLTFQVLNTGSLTQHAVLNQRNTRGNSATVITAPITLMSPLDVHVNSSAGLTISSDVSPGGGVPSAPITKLGPGRLTLSGTVTTGLQVVEGELVLEGNAIGAAPLVQVSPGATLNLTAGTNSFFFGGIETQGGPTPVTLSCSGPITVSNGFLGGGGVVLDNPGGQMTFTGSNTNSGTVEIRQGVIRIDSQGQMNQATGFLSDGALRVVTGVGSLALDRIGDTTPIRTRGGELRFFGDGSESFGNMVVDGGSSRLVLESATGLTVNSALLQRLSSGVLFVAGDALGTAGGGRLFFGTPPALVGGGGPAGTTTISILPFASGAGTSSSSFGASLLTYEGTSGLRPLNDATEYQNTFAGAPSTANLRFTNNQNLATAQTINALVMMPGVSVTGTQTLTVSSGAILTAGGGATSFSPALNFGVREGVLITNRPVTFSGPIFGSGGLTKAGAGPATLSSGTSGYSGTTTVVQGELSYVGNVTSGAAGPLGNSNTAVVLAPGAGSPVSLQAAGAGTTTFGRPLQVKGSARANAVFGSAFFTGRSVVMNGTVLLDRQLTVNGGTVVLNGAISGAGGLTDAFGFDGLMGTFQTPLIDVNGSNNFSGGVVVTAGTFRAGNNNAFGTGAILFPTPDAFSITPGPGALAANGVRTISNPVVLRDNMRVTGTGSLTLTGPIDLGGVRTHTISATGDTEYAGLLFEGGLVKAGPGRLIISGYNHYNGNTIVSAGELLVYGPKPLGDPVSGTVVSNGATLHLGQNFLIDEFGMSAANPARTVEPVAINGSGVGGNGALRSSGVSTSVSTLTVSTSSTVRVEPTSSLAVLSLDPLANTMTLVGGGTMVVDHLRGSGTVQINGGSTLRVRHEGGLGGASRVVDLTMLASRLDLTDNALVIDYPGASPVSAVSGLLSAGYASGAWTGLGIVSSLAAGTTNRSVGLAEAADIGSPPLFVGQPADTTSLLLRYTVTGDANLDRVVNIDDFGKLASNFNLPSRWSRGDFNYDGTTNIDDFGLLAANFNQSLPSGGLREAVPEPGLLTPLVLGCLFRRRRVAGR